MNGRVLFYAPYTKKKMYFNVKITEEFLYFQVHVKYFCGYYSRSYSRSFAEPEVFYEG